MRDDIISDGRARAPHAFAQDGSRPARYFAVTVDTEEDNWGEYTRASYSVENIARIPRLQEMFARRGIRPTYLVSYPVATSPRAISILGGYQRAGLCEVGTHVHPWNTPPPAEQRTPHNSYISNLPSAVQFLKIQALHETILRNFSVPPTTYRSGKWGFSDDVARNLIRLGYAVDTSIFPAWDWAPSGGPDYTRFTHEPFVYEVNSGPGEPAGSLLEVPATVGYIQGREAMAGAAYWAIRRSLPLGDKLLAALGKARVLNHVCVSPEINRAPQMIRVTEALLRRGARVINMFFHSSSLLENCSPFVRTGADVEQFFARIDEYLAFVQSSGLQPVTMAEMAAAGIGQSRVKVLAAA